VGGVAAYSTLGYFDDPVLNTFLRHGVPEVARTVFHELAHQLVFVKDDSPFNESFATTVENEGLRRWLADHATPAQRAAFEAQQACKTGFAKLMRDYRKKFQSLYATPLATDQMRQAKAELLDALRRDYADLRASGNGYAGYDKIAGADFNNARLVSFSLYNELVPAFEALLEQEKRDLPRFYRRVAMLAALDKETRCRALTGFLPAASGNGPAHEGTPCR
ncbi:MAG: aminopeptidase, partial [Gallionellaceae bacterium]|nr:aminopeptidase [Gallionellaceae bacterium]